MMYKKDLNKAAPLEVNIWRRMNVFLATFHVIGLETCKIGLLHDGDFKSDPFTNNDQY